MGRKGLRYLPLLLCLAALLGLSARACASVLAPAGRAGSATAARLAAGAPHADGVNSEAPRWVPYLCEFSGADPRSSWATVSGYFLGDDPDQPLSLASGAKEGVGGSAPAAEPDGRLPDRSLVLLGFGAGAGGMAPPSGSSGQPSPPAAGLLSGAAVPPPPKPVRLAARHELIWPHASASRIFRPPRPPAVRPRPLMS